LSDSESTDITGLSEFVSVDLVDVKENLRDSL